MISFIKLLLIFFVVLSIFLQITQAFCIYNHMSSEVATIDIYDPERDERASFKKVIDPNGKECCHYYNTDCNPSGNPDFIIYFHGWLNFNGFYREGHKKVFKREAGGGLNIYGTSPEDATAVCVRPDGGVREEAYLGDI